MPDIRNHHHLKLTVTRLPSTICLLTSLMMKLLKAGYIHNERVPVPPAPNDDAIVTKTDVPSNSADAVEPAKKEEEIITDLTQFGTEKPTLLYESVISKLYAGIQCKMCADRFVTKECVILAGS